MAHKTKKRETYKGGVNPRLVMKYPKPKPKPKKRPKKAY